MANFIQGDVTTITSVSTTKANVAVNPDCYDMLFWNAGSTVAFVKFSNGTSAIDATQSSTTSNGTPIPPGAVMVLRKTNANWMSLISSGTTTVHATPGTGE